MDAPPVAGTTSATDTARARPRLLRARVLRAVRSPSDVFALVRARLALRRCDAVPWSVRARGRIIVENYGRILIGERVRIDARTVPVELVSFGGELRVGDGTFINYGATISAHSGVQIGRDCLIGNYAMIMDSDYHDVADFSKPGETAPIVIEDNAWVGARAIVLKGVRIGQGAVVAAGAVVTRDVPPRTLVAGVPARVVREI